MGLSPHNEWVFIGGNNPLVELRWERRVSWSREEEVASHTLTWRVGLEGGPYEAMPESLAVGGEESVQERGLPGCCVGSNSHPELVRQTAGIMVGFPSHGEGMKGALGLRWVSEEFIKGLAEEVEGVSCQ